MPTTTTKEIARLMRAAGIDRIDSYDPRWAALDRDGRWIQIMASNGTPTGRAKLIRRLEAMVAARAASGPVDASARRDVGSYHPTPADAS